MDFIQWFVNNYYDENIVDVEVIGGYRDDALLVLSLSKLNELTNVIPKPSIIKAGNSAILIRQDRLLETKGQIRQKFITAMEKHGIKYHLLSLKLNGGANNTAWSILQSGDAIHLGSLHDGVDSELIHLALVRNW